MNIQGIILLEEKKLPIMKDTFIFRSLEEIRPKVENFSVEEKNWAMRGFSDKTKLSDSPYEVKNPRVHGFCLTELEKKFEEINDELSKLDVPKEDRIFLICRVFFSDEVEFSGHAYKEGDNIFIDVLKGNRPSGKDWTPDCAFKIELVENRKVYPLIEDASIKGYLAKICEDILKFEEKTYLDFTKLKTGYFFYHDLSIVGKG